eukprot:TRINITY_DN37157_c0_g1_i1.p1 TRINITY_DN37157_c0_g1~~TRINITY_DN37157_c0_g1_i1.p1  ORF type:complete len:438 (-),score=35.55 TRINITY_DN37157_c0_g1_i1:141-1454(-)
MPASEYEAPLPFSQIAGTLGVFFVFYVIQPLMMKTMQNAGVPNLTKATPYSWSTFVFMLPNYYAMIPVGFLPSKGTLAQMSTQEWKTGCLLSALDLVNQLMSKVGMMYTGPGVYILVNSTGIIWTVVMSMLVLGKKPTKVQCIGIFLVFLGLCLKVLDSRQKAEDCLPPITDPGAVSPHAINPPYAGHAPLVHHVGEDDSETKRRREMIGIVVIVISSVLDGSTFVLIEKFVKGPDAIPGPQLTCMQGMFASAALTIWTLCYTLSPGPWSEYIVGGVADRCDAHEDPSRCVADGGRTVVYCLFGLFFANVFTSSTVWWLLQNVGAVTFVVVKALKIVLVFLLSHAMFCDKPGDSDCISMVKCICAGLCVSGVVVYSMAPKPQARDTTKEENLIASNSVGMSFTSASGVHSDSFYTRHSQTPQGGTLRESELSAITTS